MLTLIGCLFHPRVTAVACKRPQSFCQKCRWQVTPECAYTLNPMKLEWADYAAGDSSGNTRSQLSQLAEPLWTDPAVKSGIHVRQLTSTKKKKETKAQAGNELSNIYILPKSSLVREKRPPLFIMPLLLPLLLLLLQHKTVTTAAAAATSTTMLLLSTATTTDITTAAVVSCSTSPWAYRQL